MTRPIRSHLLDQRPPEKHTCHKCGRVGTRGFDRDYEARSYEAYACTSVTACDKRKANR